MTRTEKKAVDIMKNYLVVLHIFGSFTCFDVYTCFLASLPMC